MFDQNSLGYFYENNDLYVFFGNCHAQFEQLNRTYPEVRFHRVKQNHGDQIFNCVDASLDWTITADAQITDKKNLALCISTADCIPVMIFDSKMKKIAAIHAGWRGVVNLITVKTIRLLVENGSRLNDLKLFIGPHIQKESFEVGDDVAELIHQTVNLNLSSTDEITKLGKRKVDLHQIFTQQLIEMGIKKEQITALEINTVADPNFHSFRRDKEKSGRQLSFIFLK